MINRLPLSVYRQILGLILFGFVMSQGYAQTQEQIIQNIRDDVFDSMAEADSLTFFNSISPGFKLIRSTGQIYTRQDLWNFVKSMNQSGTKHRLEVVENILTRIEGPTAWLVYRYRNVDNSLHYIEDAVLVKNGDTWQMELAHYSRISDN